MLGPAARGVGGGRLGLHQLEAHHLRVEAVGVGQVPHGDGYVVKRHAREHRVPSPPMRARRGLFLGWVLVGLYAAAMVAVTVTTRDGDVQPG